jgi:GntR family transcriptional regulator / MocR family aminotransferase
LAKLAPHIGLPALLLDRASDAPLTQQLYAGLASLILNGLLKSGTRLPSTRSFADELGVARNTVSAAFDQLLAEGYVESRVGSGTRVTVQLPDGLRSPDAAMSVAASGDRRRKQPSRRGLRLASTRASASDPDCRSMPLSLGGPSFDLFPSKLWARLLSVQLTRWRGLLLGYGDPAGWPPLREAIATYVAEARAVRASPDRVIVVSGSQQALDLAARVLLDPGGARAALTAAGARLQAVAIDGEGMCIVTNGTRPIRARAACLTPSHQFPLGATMSLRRRLKFLQWAERTDAWIFEDDYDSEFRYVGRPLAALQGLDTTGRVIYIGTFSKALSPALRLGFMILPEHLVEAFVAARAITDRHSPSLEQAALARFISDGHFARHIRRVRAAYAERQSALVAAAERHLNGLLEVNSAEAGMHLIGWLPEGIDDEEVARRANAEGIGVTALSACYMRRPPRGGLIMGYASTRPEQIDKSVSILGRVLHSISTRV